MRSKLLDIYSDYLICKNKYATATGLSDLLFGDISHDKIIQVLTKKIKNLLYLFKEKFKFLKK